MRILAISDIHGNHGVVSRLREREDNIYDLLIVAGDVGSSNARKICDILNTFSCPVVYVYGNHDHNLSYEFDLGSNGHHLHGRPFSMGGVRLIGFSGCPTNWGRNPISVPLNEKFRADCEVKYAAVLQNIQALSGLPLPEYEKGRQMIRKKRDYMEYVAEIRAHEKEILSKNRLLISEVLRDREGNNLYNIIVTHERLTYPASFIGASCFIHGHNHKFSYNKKRDQVLLNVAALDKPMTVVPVESRNKGLDMYNIDTGNYATFEIIKGTMRNLTLKTFGWNDQRWRLFGAMMARGVPIVGADQSQDKEMIIFD